MGNTPSKGESPLDNRFLSLDNMMGVSFYQSARFFSGNRITLGADWFRYGGRAWNEYVSGELAGTILLIGFRTSVPGLRSMPDYV